MFVAIRDIRFAKGRFALMSSVVALITLLIVLLSGLTAGLAHQSTSAIQSLPASQIAFGTTSDQPPEESFTDSAVSQDQLDTWNAAEGVDWASPIGISQTRVEAEQSGASVTVFGVQPGDAVAPAGVDDGDLVISEELVEENGLRPGQPVQVGDERLRVSEVVESEYYSHTPVVWTTVDTWRDVSPPRAGDPVGTVLAAGMADGADPQAVDAAAGTVSATTADSLMALESYSSENGSLVTMQGFLYAISALVVGAFLTVWTIQRSGDVAILKALGSSTRYLLRDALAQSLIVLLIGAGAGGAVGVGLGVLAESVLPFQLTASTTVFPVVAMIVLGMAGAALAVRRVTRVDPLTALGAVR